MDAHTIRVGDFPVDKWISLRISASLLRFALEKRAYWDHASAESAIWGMTHMTYATGREMEIDVYSTYPKEERDLSDIRLLKSQTKISVPSVGNKFNVHHPTLDPQTYSTELKDGTFYFPIIEMHTHPSTSTMISPEDNNGDGDMPALLSRHNLVYKLGKSKFEIINPALKIIASHGGINEPPFSTGFLLYQYTEDRPAFDRFASDYQNIGERIRKTKDGRTQYSPQNVLDERFANEMARSGAFKTMYFPPQGESGDRSKEPLFTKLENGSTFIDKKTISKICQKFRYTLVLRKIN